nr:immunoglobulin heavy chain junction region [Mus musculus]
CVKGYYGSSYAFAYW